MSASRLKLIVRQAGNQACIIDVEGDINASSENALMDAYNQVNTQGAKAIILNFTNLEFMNSSGIGLLVTLLIRARRNGQRLLAYGLSEHYRQIFELTRLNEAIQITSDEMAALAV